MKPRTIESETPIVPRAIAEAVLEEASLYLGEPLPRSWIRLLTTRADTIYRHNQSFHHRVRASGTSGRDRLWAFHRHWLAGLLQKHSPALYARLPAPYAVGQPLPPTAPVPRLTTSPVTKSSRKKRFPRHDFPIPEPFTSFFL